MFSEGCEVAKGYLYPFVEPGETKYVTKSCCNRHRECTPTCKDRQLGVFLDEVGGLEFDTHLSSGIYTLPSYIPTFDYHTRGLSNFNPKHYPYVAVTLQDILRSGVVYKAGALHEREVQYRINLLLASAFRGKKVILLLTGSDTLIEWVWYTRRDINFFQTLATMGFYAVSGFNFSVIDGECPVAHALAQKKSLVSCELAEQYGIKTIPHVYAINEYHIRRYITWFKNNSHVKFCVVNCQLQDRMEDVQTTVQAVKTLMQELPYLHVILQGFRITRLSLFGELLSRIHLVEKSPIKDAQMRRKRIVLPNEGRLVTGWRRTDETMPELSLHNANHRRVYFELLKKKYLPDYTPSEQLLRELLGTSLSVALSR